MDTIKSMSQLFNASGSLKAYIRLHSCNLGLSSVVNETLSPNHSYSMFICYEVPKTIAYSLFLLFLCRDTTFLRTDMVQHHALLRFESYLLSSSREKGMSSLLSELLFLSDIVLGQFEGYFLYYILEQMLPLIFSYLDCHII